MNLDSLTELFVEELKDAYDAEKQLLKALPKMGKAAFSEELREAFELHAEETSVQVSRLEQVFETLKMKPKAKACSGMAGIIAEAEELLEEAEAADPAVIDAGLIAAAQRAEHYEIASYGTLRTYAQTLGAKQAVELLQETLDEEAETDRKLTNLAVSSVNLDAAEADEEMQDEAAVETSGSKTKSSRSSRHDQHSSEDSHGSQTTQDHDTIRRWVEERGGKPTSVKGTGDGKEAGILRIDFPGYGGGSSLEEISWDEFFQKFDEQNLTFLYQEETKAGKRSNFNKLICGK